MSDGGREVAGFTGYAGDCVARALANLYFYDIQKWKTPDQTNMTTDQAQAYCYTKAYNELALGMQSLGKPKSARNGVSKKVYEPIFKLEGLVWNTCMFKGAKTRHRIENLPRGVSYILRVARHIVYANDNTIFDTWDCTRKMVYGFWAFKKYKTYGEEHNYEVG